MSERPESHAGEPRRQRVRALVEQARRQAGDLERNSSAGRGGLRSAVALVSLPGYDIEGEIHRGGQGVVYQARQRSTGRTVAVKVMRGGRLVSDRDAARFEREVHILGRLNHANIVGVLDRGQADGCAYFVMDHVSGEPIDRAAARLEITARLALFARVCDAVHAAHLRGIIHRDLKPGNVLVDEAGEPHILDFGLAKVDEGWETSSAGEARVESPEMTTTGQFVGSLPWASPEQAAGESDQIDIRTDVYSLGVMLFQMLTGRFPYPVTGSLRDTLGHIQSTPATPPSSLCRALDHEIDTVVLKCLSKERERRYDSAGALARDVRRYLADEPIEARRDSGWYLLRKTLKRYRTHVAALGAVMLVSVASAVALSVLYGRQTVLLTERDQAVRQARAELEKARQISRFVMEMLSGIDPDVAGELDKRLLRMVLDKAAARADGLTSQPDVEEAIRDTIGDTYFAIGDYSAAQVHRERVLELARARHGQESEEYFSAAQDVGALLMEQGHLARAEGLLVAAHEGLRGLLGPDAPTTLRTMGDLALLCAKQDRLGEAEALCRDFLERAADVLPEDDRDHVSVRNTFAKIRRMQGHEDEAVELYRQVIEIERSARGESHPRTLTAIGNLAVTCSNQGRYDEAEQLFERAISGFTAVLGAESPHTLWAQSHLAIMYQHAGRLDEAETLLRRTLDVQRRVLGDDHLELIDSLYFLARRAVAKGNHAEAEEWMVDCLRISEDCLPPEHQKVVMARVGLGVVLLAQKRFAAAEPYLLAGRRKIVEECAAGPAWQEGLLRHLADLYERWNASEPDVTRAARAALWRARLAATLAEHSAESRPAP